MNQEDSIQPVQESLIFKKPNKTTNRYKHNQILYNYFVTRDFKSAQEIINKLMVEHGDTHEYANMIQAYIQKMAGQLSKSIETFKKFLAFNDSDQEVLKTIAKNLQLAGRFKASLDVAQKALTLKQNDWEVFYTIGNCYYAQKDQDKALMNYKRAFELSMNETTYLRLGKFYLSLGRIEDAVTIYKKALNQQPQNNELKTLLGILMLRQGQNQEARKYLESVAGSDQRTLLGLGSILQDQQNYDEALNYYRKLIVIHPTSAHIWNNIALCYYGKEEMLQAIVSLKRAIYFDPFEPIVHFNMGLVHLHEGHNMSAFHCFQTAITLNPEDAQSYMYLGIALNRLGDYQNAGRSFEKALELDKEKDFLIYLNYCIVLLQHGDESSQYALQIYEDFINAYNQQEQFEDNRCSKQIIQDKKVQIEQILKK